MSGSGLIYAVIVGAWAAYLVPMWLRRADEPAAAEQPVDEDQVEERPGGGHRTSHRVRLRRAVYARRRRVAATLLLFVFAGVGLALTLGGTWVPAPLTAFLLLLAFLARVRVAERRRRDLLRRRAEAAEAAAEAAAGERNLRTRHQVSTVPPLAVDRPLSAAASPVEPTSGRRAVGG